MKQTASRSNNKGKFQSRDRLVVHLPLPHSTLPIYVMFPSYFFLLSIPSLLLTRGVYMVALFGRALFSRLWISISFHFPSSLASSFILSQWHDSFFFLHNRTWSHTHSKERKTAAELSFACESSGCVYNIHTYTRIHTICVCVCAVVCGVHLQRGATDGCQIIRHITITETVYDGLSSKMLDAI